jgi:hypothetical protein
MLTHINESLRLEGENLNRTVQYGEINKYGS